MVKRYQYRGKGGEIKWTSWFKVSVKSSKPAFKDLKEEYKND